MFDLGVGPEVPWNDDLLSEIGHVFGEDDVGVVWVIVADKGNIHLLGNAAQLIWLNNSNFIHMHKLLDLPKLFDSVSQDCLPERSIIMSKEGKSREEDVPPTQIQRNKKA